MNNSQQIIDTVISNLDRLTVRGVNNMALIIDSINALGALKDELAKEDKHVPADPK